MPVTMFRYTSLIALVVLLAACEGFRGAPLTGRSPTQYEVSKSLGELTRNLSTFAPQLASDPSVLALSMLPPGLPFSSLRLSRVIHRMVSPQLAPLAFSGSEVTEALLPRGAYSYNETAAAWAEQPAETGDLTINWIYDGIPASLIINWELEGGTAFVVMAIECMNSAHACEAQVQEVPTSLYASLVVGGKEAANLTVRVSYHDSPCGYLTYEPTSLSVYGTVGQDTAVVLEADLAVTMENGLDTAASSLLLTAEAGRDNASLDWSWEVSGAIARDDHCLPVGAKSIVGGKLDLGLRSVIGEEESSFNFASVVSEVMQSEHGVPQNAQVAGHVDVDAERSFDFVGRLDDENGDGIPGENVQLTFSDSTTTLETFLREQMMKTAVRTLESRLRR